MENFWNNQITPGYYDQLIKDGINKNKGIQANWHNITFSKVKEYFSGNEFHLDYACGSGTLVGMYVDVNSIGVDISDNQISYAKKKYPSKSFDVVSILGLLEFINFSDANELLKNVYKILKKDGKLLISTPNFASSVSFISYLNSFFGGMSYSKQHIGKYNKKTLEKLIKNSDFTIYKIEKIINLGIIFSFLSLAAGKKVNDILSKITKNRLGFLLFAEINK